ncbi:hypothetical protein AFK20_08035 [Enhydrobacter aerosaccus]|uniref:site-specific DNA-methyltransferase (adenine-specific) n=1 Tax=Enhydrobacter aerosaccus TaxID=225324 RepID=A0ABR5IL22_9HYPH|nr:site-specific DNA-methyltransferase [Enhydrobacter aerosaccus]KND21686.1 hypothetical protein AFK20_08035 [Enhydrobacter aerosaccus]
MKKTKLELTWIGKDKRPKLEPRILLEDTEKSYHASQRFSADDIFDNRLIFGDNLLALKALEQEFSGKVKCVFIDPPYNTGSAFTHYDDGLEHSIWLGLMRDRLEIIKRLLAENGSLWITISDDEVHYLKVLCDEIFGRPNFINEISINIKNVAGASGGGEDKKLKKNIEYILIYAKDYMQLETFKSSYTYTPIIELVEQYREEGRSWKYTTALIYEGDKEFIGSTLDGDGNEIKIYKRINPIFKSINAIMQEENLTEEEAYKKYALSLFQTQMPQSSIRPRVMEKVQSLDLNHDFYSIEYVPRSGRNKGTIYEQFYKGDSFRLLAWLKDVSEEIDGTLYKKDMQGNYWNFVRETKNLSKEGGVQFPNGKKPEALIHQIFDMCTNKGDLVLDSFAGSGTTGAVAHKMGRRWIMVELGDHIHTHIIPRLHKVIDGTDQGGISQTVGWQGGGGFRYYRLAPTLIVNDKWGNPIINPDYNPAMLAEAIAKLEGFTYQPSETLWWQHGYSTERDFIYVTTQTLSADQLQALSEEVGADRTLLICCAAYRGVTADKATERFPNLTIKKIPKMVLERCEWGHDDYSLNVANLPIAEPDISSKPEKPQKTKKLPAKKQAIAPTQQNGLFDEVMGDSQGAQQGDKQ